MEPEAQTPSDPNPHVNRQREITTSSRTFMWSKIAELIPSVFVDEEGVFFFNNGPAPVDSRTGCLAPGAGTNGDARWVFRQIEEAAGAQVSGVDWSAPPSEEAQRSIREAVIQTALGGDYPLLLMAVRGIMAVDARYLYPADPELAVANAEDKLLTKVIPNKKNEFVHAFVTGARCRIIAYLRLVWRNLWIQMDRSPNFGHGSRTSRRTTARASQIVLNRLFPLSSPKPEDENGIDVLSRQEDSHAEDTPGGEVESVATASKTQATDLNRAAHVALLAEEDYDCFQAASDPSRAMILSELMEEVRRLPDREQRILSRRLEGWEPEQIAQEEKITRNHVNVIHCLVVKKLRAIFGEAP